MTQAYARIDGGLVAEVIETDRAISDLFHPSITWVPVGADVLSGMLATNSDGAWSFSLSVVDSPPVVPASISPAQARLALLGAGLLDEVEAAVAAGDRVTQIAWQNATTIERNSPTVAALAGALGLTDVQLDDMFTTAAGIFV